MLKDVILECFDQDSRLLERRESIPKGITEDSWQREHCTVLSMSHTQPAQRQTRWWTAYHVCAVGSLSVDE